MKSSRPLQILHAEIERIGPRADGNINAGDFLWILRRTIEAVDREEEEENDSTEK